MAEIALKALVLAGGKGERLKPLTHTTAKQLLPVANRPILFYGLVQIREAGISNIGMIVSPKTADLIKEAVGDGSRWDCHITYIMQPEPLGLAHAVKTGRDFLGDSPFLMFLGDNLIKDGVHSFVQEFHRHGPDALVLLKEVADPRSFGVAELDGKGRVVRLVEKPKHPQSNYAIVGVYLFSPAVHQTIEHLQPSWRGELEITDAIQKLTDEGRTVRSHILEGWWFDTGKKEDLLEANRTLLEELPGGEVRGKVDSSSQLIGRVQIGDGTMVENSVIQGPASIAEECVVRKSFIGPYTSIGARTVVENSSLEHSILMEGCYISGVKSLKGSLIGKKVELVRGHRKARSLSLFLGDDTRVEL